MTMLADMRGTATWTDLHAVGYDGAFGYSGHNRGKCPAPGYGRALVAAGGLYVIVFEDSATRPLAGYLAGRDDAIFANNDAEGQGYPATCAIYWTADFDASWDQVKEYARGWHEHSHRPLGVYADGEVIRAAKAAGYVKYGWRTCSGGFRGSRDLTGVDMVQVCAGEAGLVPVPGHSVDTNRTQPGVSDIGAWSNSQPSPSTGGFLPMLSDAEQTELLTKTRVIHDQLAVSRDDKSKDGPATVRWIVAALKDKIRP